MRARELRDLTWKDSDTYDLWPRASWAGAQYLLHTEHDQGNRESKPHLAVQEPK